MKKEMCWSGSYQLDAVWFHSMAAVSEKRDVLVWFLPVGCCVVSELGSILHQCQMLGCEMQHFIQQVQYYINFEVSHAPVGARRWGLYGQKCWWCVCVARVLGVHCVLPVLSVLRVCGMQMLSVHCVCVAHVFWVFVMICVMYALAMYCVCGMNVFRNACVVQVLGC